MGEISADTWSIDAEVSDETRTPADVDITTVDFDQMTFAVERTLCEKHDISGHRSADDRREALEAACKEVASTATMWMSTCLRDLTHFAE